jgi:hypothetical protein
MSNVRIERMIRELQAEPAEQFVEKFLQFVDGLWPKPGVRPAASLPREPGRIARA